MTPALAELRERLPELTLRDERRLRRRIDGVRKVRDPGKRESIAREIAAEVDSAARRVERRRERQPRVEYPDELPVSARKEDLLAAIRDHQVVVVAGETGSGKTTQLPKICLELGRGVRGVIGHTQPRRLAARTVSERVAEELGSEVGDAVGYKVRFTDQSGDETFVKLMTDGILLAEIQQDRMLHQYDTIIIDEAHERSLNIDFLLGYLKQLLPRRPELKVIITSATIDPERFSRHFDDAPVVEVSGRTYPVEVRYRPLLASEYEDLPDEGGVDRDRDQQQAICDAVDELCAEGPGDILVFCSGEREIRDAADALERRELRGTEILPLYARLSRAEQQRVFQRHRKRRIVLATNVAETSLTVPGIKYVVDPGTARISRYSHRTKVQRLPIEPISQASANQRKGRCGRTSEGICIRLYSERDFLARQEFTDPEILRTNLASVILQMTSLELGDIGAFPFVEPPDRRNITDGVQLLQELGALESATAEPRKRLTETGRRLAQLPIDPRLARMVLEATEHSCAHEVMVITAALSIQDPRERPAEQQEAAQQAHARFNDKTSDFHSYLNLWNHLRDQREKLSNNQFRKQCRAEFLNYLRVREWQDIYGQLRQVVRSMGVSINDAPGDPDLVHYALLSGLLSHIGVKDEERKRPGRGQRQRGPAEFLGARNSRFAVFPGSSLAKKPPQWVMATELVETSRLWARTVARIEPAWAERLGQHLVKRTYSEPHWERKQGAVMAYEKVTLFGVPLVESRKVQYGRIDPELSRELFIRHALVEGDWETRHEFFHTNHALRAEVEDLEERARRRDILVDDETLFEFYDRRVGAEVVSAKHFDAWWKKQRRTQPDLLTFDKSMLINDSAGDVGRDDYPEQWQQGQLTQRLFYEFDPGSRTDGVTVDVPLATLNQVAADDFEWHVPGMREELVTALIKSLPKQLRRNFVPAPDHARAALARMAADGSLLDTLETELRRMTGVTVAREAWDWSKVPDHLKVTFRVLDGEEVLAEGKDLDALRDRLRPQLRGAISAAAPGIERTGLREWSIGTLPRTFEELRDGQPVRAYPALVDEGDDVAVRLLDTEPEQLRAMRAGTRRLLLLNIPENPAKLVYKGLSNQAKLVLGHGPQGDLDSLLADCVTCAVDHLVASAGGPAWDEESFAALRETVRSGLRDTTERTLGEVQRALSAANDVRDRMREASGTIYAAALPDVKQQFADLVHPGFVTATGYRRLPDLPRYLRAIQRRLDKLPEGPRRDAERMAEVHQAHESYRRLLEGLTPEQAAGDDVRAIGWMLEELRVSFFAQTLGTPQPVSVKRILRAIDAVSP